MQNPVRNICAAGHKALYHKDWGGYPENTFLGTLHPELARIRKSLDDAVVQPINKPAGKLSQTWASKLGLKEGIPVATGALDAHLGAVGSGVKQGTMIKIMGTSTCDIIVAPQEQDLPFIPGLCGIVPESVLPEHHGLEAGQSAVGDLFGWWVDTVLADTSQTHASLTEEAALLNPGESGLLALDWNNGNRCLLCDPQLTGLILGQTIQTKSSEIYRALIEATAFGAKMILDQIADHGVQVDKVIACGGLAEQNPTLMQIYADITQREILVSSSDQTCALGAAIAGSVVGGIYSDIRTAQSHLTSTKSMSYKPDETSATIYKSIFKLYKQLHDSFGSQSDSPLRLNNVMKELMKIRQEGRNQAN
jgi:L-ribulokinase